MHEAFQFLGNFWWLIFVFGGTIGGALKGVAVANERRIERRQERFRLKQQTKVAIAQANALLSEETTPAEQQMLTAMVADNVERLQFLVDARALADDDDPDVVSVEIDEVAPATDAPPSDSPIELWMVRTMSSPGESAANSQNQTPSGNWSICSTAIWSDNRDLPVPPGPSSVTNRWASNRSWIEFNSSFRPTNDVV